METSTKKIRLTTNIAFFNIVSLCKCSTKFYIVWLFSNLPSFIRFLKFSNPSPFIPTTLLLGTHVRIKYPRVYVRMCATHILITYIATSSQRIRVFFACRILTCQLKLPKHHFGNVSKQQAPQMKAISAPDLAVVTLRPRMSEGS